MKERVHYLSLANVISIIAVVIIHVNSLFFWNFEGAENWWISNLIETAMRFAVPVFFMSSGANLIEYSERYSTKEFFKKRCVKIGIPFLAWSCLGGFVYTVLTGQVELVLSINGLKAAILQYTGTGVYLMYWFLIIISGAYLYIPILTYLKKEYKEKMITYLIVIIFLIKYVAPFLCRVSQVSYESSSLISDRIMSYFIFILLGYILHKKELTFKWRVVTYALGMIGFVLQAYGTYFFSEEAGFTVEFFGGYNNLPCLLWAVGVFVFIKQCSTRIKSECAIKWIEGLSGYTFSIYLIHFFFVDYFSAYIREVDAVIMQMIIALIILVLSICVIWVIRRIPGGKKILP